MGNVILIKHDLLYFAYLRRLHRDDFGPRRALQNKARNQIVKMRQKLKVLII